MKKLSLIFLLVFCVFISTISQSFAAINFTLTPIKYELELAPWETITLPASIRNNGTDSVTLPTATSDFIASGENGQPKFVRKSELVFPEQQLSTWISLEKENITVWAGQEVSMNFTINVPENASPGWHYGAVFFKRPASEVSSSWNIGINVDYGIIILVNVEGETDIEWEIDTPIISNQSTWSSGYFSTHTGDISSNPENGSWYLGKDENGNDTYLKPDSCPLGDFTTSRFDKKCFWEVNNDSENIEDSKESSLFESDFLIQFDFPIKNIGNTHIKPVGKVTLIDDKGNTIKAIGKETLTNEAWAIIGEKIVDYIPINDGGGNILPKTKRVFISEWKWFPYKAYDDSGNQIINYWSPSNYYSMRNKDSIGFLMPWQRINEVVKQKYITANTEIVYLDENGKEVNFNAAQEFPIQYVQQEIHTNPYVILGLLLLLTATLILWFMLKRYFILLKRNKCWKCKEKIKSHWETCPYCETIQNKKQHKKYLKQKEED